MKFVEVLASYLPSLIVDHLKEHETTANPPGKQVFETVCMFADVSGFTKLSEAMAKYGPEGAEHLTRHLNSYFGQMVKSIAAEGGDIFKFAGDAMIILWPEKESLETRARHAIQCAVEVQTKLHAAELQEGVTLSVKLGIGCGRISVLHLGGVLNRMEYVAVGEPLVQAFAAEGKIEAGGEIVVSPQVWNLVSETVRPLQELSGGFMQLTKGGVGHDRGVVARRLPRKGKMAMLDDDGGLDSAGAEVERRLRGYCPGAIQPWINPHEPDQEAWGSGLRNVTILFVNLGLKDHDLLAAAQYDDAAMRAHNTLKAVQSAVYAYEGSVNKFLMDDKGSTLIAVFGLPPLSHADDPTRGVLAGLSICDKLWDLGLQASVGVTTGVVFCGVVGSTTRKEYTVLGDTVNLSARLMSKACKTGGGVIVDLQIRRACDPALAFQDLGEIRVKGKSMPIRVFRPYPEDLGLPLRSATRNAPGSEPRWFKMAYEAQVSRFHAHRHLRERWVEPAQAGEQVLHLGEAEEAEREAEKEAAAAAAAAAAGGGGSAGSRAVGRVRASLGTGLARAGAREGELVLDTSHVKRRRPAELGSNLLSLWRAPGRYTAATTPVPLHLLVNVPRGLNGESQETLQAVNYGDRQRLPAPVAVDEESTLRSLRDAAVQAAAAAGMLSAEAAADPRQFLLQIEGSLVLLPPLDLPIKWLTVLGLEMGALSLLKPKRIQRLPVRLIRARDRATVQPVHFRAAEALAVNKMRLLARGRGSVTVIEGEGGTGKSRLLSHFVRRVMPNKSSLFVTSGSPFRRFEPYAVWAGIVQQFLRKLAQARDLMPKRSSKASAGENQSREEKEEAAAEVAAAKREAMTTAAAQALGGAALDPRLVTYGPLLNPLLGIELKDETGAVALLNSAQGSEEELADRKRRKAGLVRALMLAMLRAVVQVHPACIIIDDAQSLPPAAWELALELGAAASQVPGAPDSLPLMLVLSTRPPDRYVDVIFRAPPPAYKALVNSGFCGVHRLDRLGVLDARAMVAFVLGWAGAIHHDLFATVEGVAQGNPFVIMDTVLHMLAKGRIALAPEADGAPQQASPRTPGGSAMAPIAEGPTGSRGVGDVCNGEGGEEGEEEEGHSGIDYEHVGLTGTAVVPPAKDSPCSFVADLAAAGRGAQAAAARAKAARSGRARRGAAPGLGEGGRPPKGVLVLVDGLETRVPFCPSSHSQLATLADRIPVLKYMTLQVGAVIAHTVRERAAREAQKVPGNAASGVQIVPAGGRASVAGSKGRGRRQGPRMSLSDHMMRDSIASRSGTQAGALSSDRFKSEFRVSVLKDVFPLREMVGQLEGAIASLVADGFLREHERPPMAGTQGPRERVLQFTWNAFPEALRLRILQERRAEVSRRVEEALLKRDNTAKRVAIERLISSRSPAGGQASFRKVGTLLVRKNEDGASRTLFRRARGQWKSRWVVLSGNQLRMFRSESEETAKREPVQVIDLARTAASVLPQTGEWEVKSAFKLDAKGWVKKGEKQANSRVFYFGSDSARECEEWVYMLGFVADKIKTEERKAAAQARRMRDKSRQRASVASGSTGDEEAMTASGSPLAATMRPLPPGPSVAGGARGSPGRLLIEVSGASKLLPAELGGFTCMLVRAMVVRPTGDLSGSTAPAAASSVATSRVSTARSIDPECRSTLSIRLRDDDDLAAGVVLLQVLSRSTVGVDKLVGTAVLPVSTLVDNAMAAGEASRSERTHVESGTPQLIAARPSSTPADKKPAPDGAAAGARASAAAAAAGAGGDEEGDEEKKDTDKERAKEVAAGAAELRKRLQWLDAELDIWAPGAELRGLWRLLRLWAGRGVDGRSIDPADCLKAQVHGAPDAAAPSLFAGRLAVAAALLVVDGGNKAVLSQEGRSARRQELARACTAQLAPCTSVWDELWLDEGALPRHGDRVVQRRSTRQLGSATSKGGKSGAKPGSAVAEASAAAAAASAGPAAACSLLATCAARGLLAPVSARADVTELLSTPAAALAAAAAAVAIGASAGPPVPIRAPAGAMAANGLVFPGTPSGAPMAVPNGGLLRTRSELGFCSPAVQAAAMAAAEVSAAQAVRELTEAGFSLGAIAPEAALALRAQLLAAVSASAEAQSPAARANSEPQRCSACLRQALNTIERAILFASPAAEGDEKGSAAIGPRTDEDRRELLVEQLGKAAQSIRAALRARRSSTGSSAESVGESLAHFISQPDVDDGTREWIVTEYSHGHGGGNGIAARSPSASSVGSRGGDRHHIGPRRQAKRRHSALGVLAGGRPWRGGAGSSGSSSFFSPIKEAPGMALAVPGPQRAMLPPLAPVAAAANGGAGAGDQADGGGEDAEAASSAAPVPAAEGAAVGPEPAGEVVVVVRRVGGRPQSWAEHGRRCQEELGYTSAPAHETPVRVEPALPDLPGAEGGAGGWPCGIGPWGLEGATLGLGADLDQQGPLPEGGEGTISAAELCDASRILGLTRGWVNDPLQQLQYEAEDGELQGPFAARDVYLWAQDDFFPEGMEIRAGGEGCEEINLSERMPAVRVRFWLSGLQGARAELLERLEAGQPPGLPENYESALGLPEGADAERCNTMPGGDGSAERAVELGLQADWEAPDPEAAAALEVGGVPPDSRLWAQGMAAARRGDPLSWSFDMEAGGDAIAAYPATVTCVMASVLCASRVFRFFPVSSQQLGVFLQGVEDAMMLHSGATRYHTLQHATDVTQAVLVMVRTWQAERLLTATDVLGLMLAATCHDLEHPGLNNAYQVNAETDLALRYSDQSVLENHHAARASELLKQSGLLSSLPKATAKAVRSTIVSAILFTDMKEHFGIVDQLKGIVRERAGALQAALADDAVAGLKRAAEAGCEVKLGSTDGAMWESGPAAVVLPADVRLHLVHGILHAADISNPARPWPVCKLWTDRVNGEFWRQGDREKEEDLPISMGCDRDTANKADSSVKFGDFIVAPLYKALADILPRAELAVRNIASNRERWVRIRDEHLDDDTSPSEAGDEAAPADHSSSSEEADVAAASSEDEAEEEVGGAVEGEADDSEAEVEEATGEQPEEADEAEEGDVDDADAAAAAAADAAEAASGEE